MSGGAWCSGKLLEASGNQRIAGWQWKGGGDEDVAVGDTPRPSYQLQLHHLTITAAT